MSFPGIRSSRIEQGKPGVGNWRSPAAWLRPGEIESIGRRRVIAYHDAIFEFSFQTDGAVAISLSLNLSGRMFARLYLFKDSITLRARQPGESGDEHNGSAGNCHRRESGTKWS